MKTVLSILCLTFLSFNLSAQIPIEVEMGSKTYKFTAHEIFNGNESENTYYNIEDGVLHYYYVNNYEGKNIQYIHTSCSTKSLNLKTLEYKDYDESGKFMYITTKKLAKDVTKTEVSDGELSGASLGDNIKTEEESGTLFMIIINSEEMGNDLAARIKKGK